MEENYPNTRTRNIKKLVMSRDSFQRLVKENEPLNKNLGKLHENYYNNIKIIFDSDEKKTQVMSFIEKLRFKNRLRQRSVSPLLLKYDKYGISEKSYTKDIRTLKAEKSTDSLKCKNKYYSHKLRKNYEKVQNELSENYSLYNLIEKDNENSDENNLIDKNIIISETNSFDNNINEKNIENEKETKNSDENIAINDNKSNNQLIEGEKKITNDKNNKEKKLKNNNKKNKEYDIIPNIESKKKKDNLQITYTRINISTLKKKNNDNKNRKLLKEKFFFTIKPKLLTFKKKKIIHPKKNELQKDSMNFSIKSKNKKDNFTGLKLIQYEEGKIKKEILLNESIERINKKLEEEKIKIDNIQLKFNIINEYTKEIDQTVNFNIISNIIREKVKLNLVNKGMNTLRDKRKFKEIGINVSYNPITSNSGNNTEINLVNWDKLFQKNNLFDKNVNKSEKNIYFHKSNSNVLKNIKRIKNDKKNIINLKNSVKLENKKIQESLDNSYLKENLSFLDN